MERNIQKRIITPDLARQLAEEITQECREKGMSPEQTLNYGLVIGVSAIANASVFGPSSPQEKKETKIG